MTTHARAAGATGSITYRLTPRTPLSVTVAAVYEASETAGPEPLERLAAAFYEDLHQIARQTTIPPWQALAAPDTYADQPDLLARLVSADVEQLLRDQLIAGVALVLSDPADDAAGGAGDASMPVVRYCAAYILRRLVSPLPDEPVAPPYSRTIARFDPSRHAGPASELALLVAWYPTVSAAERAATITFPRYQFQWTALTAVTFDDTQLRPPPQTPLVSSGGAWTRTQLDGQTSRQLEPF
jgi:hypothetical protein